MSQAKQKTTKFGIKYFYFSYDFKYKKAVKVNCLLKSP